MAALKAKRRLYGTALRKLRLLTEYRIAALLAITFGWPFWISEQWRGRVADWIDDEASEQ